MIFPKCPKYKPYFGCTDTRYSYKNEKQYFCPENSTDTCGIRVATETSEDNRCKEAIDKVSTAELIAELERRRPDCRKCVNLIEDCAMDNLSCIWRGTEDLFKEKK